jgi:hypothetical protein
LLFSLGKLNSIGICVYLSSHWRSAGTKFCRSNFDWPTILCIHMLQLSAS